VGGTTPKDDETRTLSRSGSNGDGTAEHLVGSPWFVVGQHHSWEKGCGSEMLSSCGDVDDNDGANDDGWFQMNVPPLIN
jgi:hypothetical protein